MLFCELCTETLKMFKANYSDDAMGKTQVFEWFSTFQSGEKSIDDQLCYGRPSMAQTDEKNS